MLKKLLIEDKDKYKLAKWNDSRYDDLMKRLRDYSDEKTQEYIIGLDIASPDSKDESVMIKLRKGANEWLYEGYEII